MYGVYLVDDEKLMIDSVITAISWPEYGFEVIGANDDPVMAAAEIISLKPDLVICDLKMPRLDGIGLIKTLKDASMNCEFIMLSAFGEFEASRDFFLMGGADYLLKPLDPQEAALVLEKLSRKLAEKNHLSPRTTPVATQTKAFDELVEYISGHFDEKHTLDSLSKQFNISPNYICNLFSKHYDSTLTIFLTSIRMREASKLLKETDTPLKDIAVRCGYQDYFYFSRMFKSYFGIPPTEYRESA